MKRRAKTKQSLAPRRQEAPSAEESKRTVRDEQHPIAVGATAAGGGMAGAAIGAAGGAIAGPVGAAAGAAVGAILGGLAGKQLAETFAAEDVYFRQHFESRKIAAPARNYDDYQPAYRYGWEASQRFEGAFFEEIEPELQRGWTTAKPSLPWEEARLAAREAWDRRRHRLLDATQRPSEAPDKRIPSDRTAIPTDAEQP